MQVGLPKYKHNNTTVQLVVAWTNGWVYSAYGGLVLRQGGKKVYTGDYSGDNIPVASDEGMNHGAVRGDGGFA